MKIWKDKKGEKISFKEFMKRFKEGIETINPLQKIKIQLGGTKIMLIGLFLGLFVSIYGWRNMWWVGIILIGAILNTGVQFLGLRQQKKILDDLEKRFKETNEEVEISLDGKEKLGMSEMGIEMGKYVDKIFKEEEDNIPLEKMSHKQKDLLPKQGDESQETNLEDVGESDTFKTHALKKSKSSPGTSNNLDKEKEVK